MSPAVALAALLVALTAAEVVHDYDVVRTILRRSEGRLWHAVDAASWAVIYAALGYFALGGWTGAARAALAGGALRLGPFALALNALRGLPLAHRGEADPVDAYALGAVHAVAGDAGVVAVRAAAGVVALALLVTA